MDRREEKSSTIRDATSQKKPHRTEKKKKKKLGQVEHHTDGGEERGGAAGGKGGEGGGGARNDVFHFCSGGDCLSSADHFTQCCYMTTIDITIKKLFNWCLVDCQAGDFAAFHRLFNKGGGCGGALSTSQPQKKTKKKTTTSPEDILSPLCCGSQRSASGVSHSQHFSTTTCLPKPHIFDKDKQTKRQSERLVFILFELCMYKGRYYDL